MNDERPVAGAGTLGSLIEALEGLADQSRALAQDVRTDASQRRVEDARRGKAIRAVLAVGVVIVALVAAVLFVGWQNHQLGKQNRRLANQIADCTTAGGSCYEEGRRRAGGNLDFLLRAEVYAQSCREQPGVDTDAEVLACVRAKLAAEAPTR